VTIFSRRRIRFQMDADPPPVGGSSVRIRGSTDVDDVVMSPPDPAVPGVDDCQGTAENAGEGGRYS